MRRVSKVVLMAAMPLDVTMAALQFSTAATLFATAYTCIHVTGNHMWSSEDIVRILCLACVIVSSQKAAVESLNLKLNSHDSRSMGSTLTTVCTAL